MKKLIQTLVVFFLLIAPTFASAAKLPRTSTTGNDISFPQCGKTLPSGQAFGIVGVNGGLANDFNSCFSTELAWAQTSNGSTLQPKAQLYVNTANPGDVTPMVADWPTSSIADDPYGTCQGAVDAACSWEYGYERATADINFVGSGNFHWWLDVETANSWTNSTAKNQADLEGMVHAFANAGGRVGLYSTAAQWQTIAGTVNGSSSLAGLLSWLPGARTKSAAVRNCKLAPLTIGGQVTLTQWTQSGLDSDYSCM